jgi:GxxExxY protein
MAELLHRGLTNQILKSFFCVYNKLGHGFLERIYKNALSLELKNCGLEILKEHPIKVYYCDQLMGEYYADMVVENLVIVEVKAVETLIQTHEAQLLNYLKATEIEVGMLLNFGPKPQFRRRVFGNARKFKIR